MTIPEEEQDRVVAIFWLMLRVIEARTKPEIDASNKLLVENGFDMMNRIGVTTNVTPVWRDKEIKASLRRKLEKSQADIAAGRKKSIFALGD